MLCLGLTAPAAAQSLRVGRPAEPIRIDGRLTEAAWFRADSIDGLTEVEPVSGRRPASRTVVRVLATERGLYVGVVAINPPGVRNTSYSKARDSNIKSEDYLAIVFDTFQDGRSGYVFAVNPNGARVDGLVSQRGEDVDPSWDAIWDVKTTRSDSGWSAEFQLPIKSLIFRPGLEEWGFNVERVVQATREKSRWISPSPDVEITQTSRAGVIEGLPDFSLGVGLTLRPAVTVGGSRPAPDSAFTGTFHPSLDVTQRVGGDLLAHLTVNTDFAETEVDTRRTNLTRFPLFFPEKRSFFLEGSDIFEFGLGSGNDVRPFFSRRIGLYQGREVPLVVGGKVNGRAGQTNIGALITITDEVDGLVPVAGEGALRITQNVFEESSVGVIATVGDPAGRNSAWTAGADFTYQTSKLGGDKNFLVGVWGVLTGRDSLSGDRSAIGGKIDYPNDLWDVGLTWKRIGESFDPSLGFVPRPGVWLGNLGGSYSPRPGKWGIRQLHFEVRSNIATDLDFNWESWRVYASPFNAEFDSGDRVEIGASPQGERLEEEFEVADGVVIPPGSYGYTRGRIEFKTSSARRFGLGGDYSFGGFYDGTLHQVELGGVWRPSATFNLSFEGEYNIGSLPQGDFTQTLVGSRVQLNVSTALQISTFWQYDTESRDLGTNTRLRWSFSPLGDVFLVYNHNASDPETGSMQFKSNDLRLKVQYSFRF